MDLALQGRDVIMTENKRYPLFVSHWYNCTIFYGSPVRQKAPRIAKLKYKKSGKIISFGNPFIFEAVLQVADQAFDVQLTAMSPANIADVGLTGILHFSATEFAEITVEIREPKKAYRITVSDCRRSWKIGADVELDVETEKINVNICRNDELVVSAPGINDGYWEELCSCFRLVRYHWGDVLNNRLSAESQIQSDVACLLCICIYNSAIGTQLLADYPTG